MRRDFVERDEDEGTFGEARVRKLEACFAEHEIAVENEIEVESARTIVDREETIATEVEFDLEER